MSHLHIPDGILPLWLIAVGWLVTALLLWLAMRSLRKVDKARIVPHIGVVAAFVIAAMSTEIVPIAYHVNLTVLAGIVIGPAPAVLVAFVVNVVLSLFGHGGVTVGGLNTLITAAEMVLGYALFHGLLRFAPGRPGLAAGVATVITLFLTTTLSIGIVALSQISPSQARDLGSLDPSTLTLRDPFSGGLFANRIVTPEGEAGQPVETLSLRRFAISLYLLGSVGWALEALLVGSMVSFMARVRPGLLRRALLAGPP
jgi:cobalt/nickel transport system permease protein